MLVLQNQIKHYQKEVVESPKPLREKLKSDYSFLQSSDLRVEVALKLSTVNCQLSTVEGGTIEQTVQHLGQSSDQINALTQAKIGQFSVDILIVMLDRVSMTVKVEICPPGSLGMKIK